MTRRARAFFAAGAVVWIVSAVVAVAWIATDDPSPDPAPGAANLRPRVLVVGDEIAGTAGGGLERWMDARGSMTVLVATTPGCGLLRAEEGCDWTSYWPQQIEDFDPDVVVVLTGIDDLGGDDAGDEARRAHEVLTAGGAQVVWVSGPRVEIGQVDGVPPAVADPASDPALMIAYNDTIATALVGEPDVHIVDLYSWLESQPGGATAIVRRPDGVRFTAEGAAELAAWLGPRIESLVPGCGPTIAPTPSASPAPGAVEILVVGDSLALGILPPIAGALADEECGVSHEGRTGFLAESSLDRWRETLTTAPPDVIVLLFATWENFVLQGGEVIDPGDPGWPDLYRRTHVEPWASLVAESGTDVVWIGMPLVRDPAIAAQHQELNAVWASVAAEHPSITWIDGAAVLAGPDGGYLEIDGSVDPPVRLFSVDGLHLCPEGARRLAAQVLDVLSERHGLIPGDEWADGHWADDPDSYRPGECPDPVSG